MSRSPAAGSNGELGWLRELQKFTVWPEKSTASEQASEVDAFAAALSLTNSRYQSYELAEPLLQRLRSDQVAWEKVPETVILKV